MVRLVGGWSVTNGATASSFHITSFSKLFSVRASEFCHTNTFNGNEMFTRLDTLFYESFEFVVHFRGKNPPEH